MSNIPNKPRYRCEFVWKDELTYVFSRNFHDLKDGFWLDDARDHVIADCFEGNVWIPPSAIRYIQRER